MRRSVPRAVAAEVLTCVGQPRHMVASAERRQPGADEPQHGSPDAVSRVVPAEVDRRHHGEREEHPEGALEPAAQPEPVRDDADGHRDADVKRRERRDRLHGVRCRRVGEHGCAVVGHRLLDRRDRCVREAGEDVRVDVDRTDRRDQEVRDCAESPVDADRRHQPRPARDASRPHEGGREGNRHQHDPREVDE